MQSKKYPLAVPVRLWYATTSGVILKDEILLTVGCTIFPPMYLFITKYVFTGSFKNRSIDI
jgi:hypothetical protein